MPTRRRLLVESLAVAAGAALGRSPAMSQMLPRTPEEWRDEYEQARRRAIEALPFDRISVPGTTALAEWRRLREAGRGWPVVVGGDDQLDRIAEQFSLDDPAVFPAGPIAAPPRTGMPAEILARAAELRFPDGPDCWDGSYAPDELTAQLGEWPPQAPPRGPVLALAQDFETGAPLETATVLLIQADTGAEVPAYLRWGGWNACPPPEWHVAMLRFLAERHGAELVGIGGDMLEVVVPRLPGSRDEALALARILYAYCPDNVDQGSGTLAPFAAELMANPVWTFWWD